MAINEWLILLFGGSLWIAAGDKLFGCRLGLGQNLEDGLMFMGKVASNMFGIMTLSPILTKVLVEVLGPVCAFLGADACMSVAMFLSPDCGGYLMAVKAASSEMAGKFAGCVVAATVGPVLLFYLPMAMILMAREDWTYLAEGVICGVSVTPLACLAGGAVAGYPLLWMLQNLLPCILLVGCLVVCFTLWPQKTGQCVLKLGKAVRMIATVGIAAGGFTLLTGRKILTDALPLETAIQSVGYIGVMLAGSMTFLEIVNRMLKLPLQAAARRLGVDENSVIGVIMTLATNLTTMTQIHMMVPSGKVANVAFIMAAACALGPHLGYISQMQPDMVPAMLTAKLTGGILAVLVVMLKRTRSLKK